MSKKNKKGNNNVAKNEAKNEVKKETAPMDNAKKVEFKKLMEELIADTAFPKFSKEKIDAVVEAYKISEKTLKAFCNKLEKFSVAFAKKDKEKKKKAKEIDADLMAKIQEIATVTAKNLATKLLKTSINFSKLVVEKKSKKENANSNGKIIFVTADGSKEYFLCWDYKNNDLFIGSTLHELTKEIKDKLKI
ncbi:MAG TPA: hypothetical protein PK941_07835 [Paludibacter sp.]|nr:hypothetical protein [Paludibacter sp.]